MKISANPLRRKFSLSNISKGFKIICVAASDGNFFRCRLFSQAVASQSGFLRGERKRICFRNINCVIVRRSIRYFDRYHFLD